MLLYMLDGKVKARNRKHARVSRSKPHKNVRLSVLSWNAIFLADRVFLTPFLNISHFLLQPLHSSATDTGMRIFTGQTAAGRYVYHTLFASPLTKIQTYPVDPPQEFDDPGKEMGPDAQVWKTYVRETDQVDRELVDGWDKCVSWSCFATYSNCKSISMHKGRWM